MKTAVVYYSLENNCDYVAHKIAKQLDADLVRLEPTKPYPASGPAKFLVGGRAAISKAKPDLKPFAFDLDTYDTIVLGTPVWAGSITPPLRTFLSIYDLAGKQIALYTCSSSGSAGKCLEQLIAESHATSTLATMALKDPGSKPSDDNDRRITEFCDALGG